MDLVVAVCTILGGIAAVFGIIKVIQVWCEPPQPPAPPNRADIASSATSPPAAPKSTDLPRLPPRNPDFTGREEDLKALRASLLEGGTAALTQAITGLGGVGKTQLATEYAYRYRDGYDHILWVRSEEPTQLADDFAGLAKLLDLPEQDEQDRRIVIQAVCQWLARNGGWLLVFDNVPHPDSLQGYRPEEGHGHVIITSRDRHWEGVAKLLPVEVWPPDESLAFLNRMLGRTDQVAAELAEELGHLPLALAQAAAYIKNSGTSLEDYVKLYRERREELWRDEKPPPEYPETAGTTWSITFDAARKEEPAADGLLNLLAFLAPDDIPRDLLATVIEDPLALNRAIAALRRYSLITTADDALSIHRLVQAVTRDRLSEEERKKWAGIAVQLLGAAFPFRDDDPATWEESGRLLPHALAAAAEHAAATGVELRVAGSLLNSAAMYLRVRAEFAAARTVLERNLAITETAYGTDHVNMAAAISNLGEVLREMGDPKGAKVHLERALSINERTYGPDHPAVATSVNNIGNVLYDLGDLEGAREHFERALIIDEKTHGPDCPNVAIRLNNLGLVLREMGDPEKARPYLERALSIFEKAYGPDHPMVGMQAGNLGKVLRVLGDLEGARACCERSLAIITDAYPEGHPSVAVALADLADVFQDLGDLAGAKAHYERALAIFVKCLGEAHPQTQLLRRNLEALGKK